MPSISATDNLATSFASQAYHTQLHTLYHAERRHEL